MTKAASDPAEGGEKGARQKQGRTDQSGAMSERGGIRKVAVLRQTDREGREGEPDGTGEETDPPQGSETSSPCGATRYRGIRIRFGGPEVRLTARLTLAVVMALHELATNAVKYGGLSNESGRVILNWEVEGPVSKRLSLRWEELDGPPVEKPSRVGFGTRMIERVLAAEFGGEAKIDYRTHGLVLTLEAPLPEREGG